ncbi:MAG: hypothetical protein EBY93_02385, partial [Actinobacteria bacterium]|nr:hypothetical protein [Actinomycetota bacterium]
MAFKSLSDPKWATRAVDLLDRVLDGVRNRTTRPLVIAVRAIVFGLLIAVGACVAFVFALIGLFRGANELFDLWWDRDTAVWVSYVVLGSLFVLIGLRTL